MGLGLISDNFVWEWARLGAVFDFISTILHTKVSNNSLIICNSLERYLKEFWTRISNFEFFCAPRIC